MGSIGESSGFTGSGAIGRDFQRENLGRASGNQSMPIFRVFPKNVQAGTMRIGYRRNMTGPTLARRIIPSLMQRRCQYPQRGTVLVG